MSKRILALVFVLLMVLSIALTGCSSEKSDDEKRRENASAGDTAYTLSIWIPTNSNTDDQAYKNRLVAIENAINAELATDNTRIKLELVSDELYEQKLSQSLANAQNSVLADPSKKPYLQGMEYVNDAEKEYPSNAEDEDDYFYKLKFPAVLDNQIDICLIRDYNTYSQYVKNGYLHSLNAYITSESATYPRFKKIIKNELIDALTIDKNLYAVPNNRAYADDEYQFILINKELAAQADVVVDVDSIKSIVDCEEIICKIGELATQNVVPFVGGENSPLITYWGEGDSLIVSNNGSSILETIIQSEEYLDYTLLYKKLNELNYIKSSLVDGEKAGVSVFNGTLAQAQALEKDYYLVKIGTPVMDEEDVFGSMFAITEYSINYDRAMTVLYALNTNEKIRTLIQYGIEDVDYVLDRSEDEENPVIKVNRDENGKAIYDMNNDYTGNGYITYRNDGTVIDDWTYIKTVNYDAKISQFLHFKTNYQNGRSEQDKAQDVITSTNIANYAASIYAEIDAMSVAEFEAFAVAAKIQKKLNDGKKEYDELSKKTQRTSEEQEKVDAYKALLEQENLCKENEFFQKLYTSTELADALNHYTSLTALFN